MYQSDHKSVLINEALDFLNVKQGGRYIDCNLGGGGHSKEILDRGGKVLALEIDDHAIEFAKNRLAVFLEKNREQLFISQHNFREVDKAVKESGWDKEPIDGILYDLGLSTFQIKDAHKGFSYEDETPLDMRMDERLQVKAEDLIRMLPEGSLSDLIYEYGEEPQAKTFARVLKSYAEKNPKFTAKDIAEILKTASRYPTSRVHPATRVFQALRIAVNSELENLRESLSRAVPLLHPGSRLVIISFHSLEDRISKELKKRPDLKPLTNNPVLPSEAEVLENPSSRSAKLRAYEKI